MSLRVTSDTAQHTKHSGGWRGFTILETLFSLAIISLVLIISLGGFQNYQRRTNIGSAVHQLLSYVERARVLSTVRYASARYGIHFDQNQYVLFKGPTYQAGASGNEVRTLTGFRFADPNVFANGTGGSTHDVVFKALSGETINTGTIRLESTADVSLFRLITINALGTVTVQ